MKIFGKQCGGTAFLTKKGWINKCQNGKECTSPCRKEITLEEKFANGLEQGNQGFRKHL